MNAIKESNKTLSELKKDIVIYPQLLENILVKDKNVVLEDKDINNAIEEVKNDLKDEGRILVRPSGTEPLIRVMVEAKTINTIKRIPVTMEAILNNEAPKQIIASAIHNPIKILF